LIVQFSCSTVLGAKLCYGYGAAFYMEALCVALCLLCAGLNVAIYILDGNGKRINDSTTPLLGMT